MKQTVFVDTSAWLALINEADADHAAAKTIRDKLLHNKKRFLVTDYIIVEIANSLCKTRWRSHAVKLVNSIRETGSIEVVEIEKEILADAWNMYSTRTRVLLSCKNTAYVMPLPMIIILNRQASMC